MQGADQHSRSSLGFSILPKDTVTCTATAVPFLPSLTAFKQHFLFLYLFLLLYIFRWMKMDQFDLELQKSQHSVY